MLSDVQYRELHKYYADPVRTLGEHKRGGLLRSIFINYVNIKDIVSCSLVNRSWKQMLSNDPKILLSLPVRPLHLNSGFKLQPAFFSNSIRNNSDIMLKFIKMNRNHKLTDHDRQIHWYNLSCHVKQTLFFVSGIEFLGDQLDKKFFIAATKIFGSRLFSIIPVGHFDDPEFVLALADNFRDRSGGVLFCFMSEVISEVISIDNSQYWLSIFEKCEKLDIFKCLQNYVVDPEDQDFFNKVNEIKNKRWVKI